MAHGPASQRSSQPASQSASQRSSQPASQPAVQPASQPVVQTASQPVVQTASQPAVQPASQQSSQPASGPASSPTAKQLCGRIPLAAAEWGYGSSLRFPAAGPRGSATSKALQGPRHSTRPRRHRVFSSVDAPPSRLQGDVCVAPSRSLRSLTFGTGGVRVPVSSV
ncbi:transcriptional regulatory protein AlgP-like [Schistocerca gregaria]|uniref:transcriptional regulatory protein AlgP-like n=1 Tax=Schistocerca gregaria TaxID=7010 RepID=UPI00211E70E6|nr:transcriptional regulatory protein AlgP-like [Schistocerca gregaria]